MLDYLMPVAARRALLRLLWGEPGEGGVREASVRALAERARVSYGMAHRELEEMERRGLALSRVQGRERVFAANLSHPKARLLKELAALEKETALEHPAAQAPPEEVRGWLKDAGAPLLAEAPKKPAPRLEKVLALGVQLSHADAAVARALPVALWRSRGALDFEKLAEEAGALNEKQALGFFLELSGALAGDAALKKQAALLEDGRRSVVRDFFWRAQSPRARRLAAARTPALARRWHYRMNLDLETWRSLFEKHAQADNI